MFSIQIETLKKELEHSNDTYSRLKQTMDTLLANQQQKEKVTLHFFIQHVVEMVVLNGIFH
jgi:hypothetical protein